MRQTLNPAMPEDQTDLKSLLAYARLPDSTFIMLLQDPSEALARPIRLSPSSSPPPTGRRRRSILHSQSPSFSSTLTLVDEKESKYIHVVLEKGASFTEPMSTDDKEIKKKFKDVIRKEKRRKLFGTGWKW